MLNHLLSLDFQGQGLFIFQYIHTCLIAHVQYKQFYNNVHAFIRCQEKTININNKTNQKWRAPVSGRLIVSELPNGLIISLLQVANYVFNDKTRFVYNM